MKKHLYNRFGVIVISGTSIISKEYLNPSTVRMVIRAPLIARRALPGQFVMLKTGEWGERVPLTVAGHDSDTVTVIFQVVGRTTSLLAALAPGESIDAVGPLGTPTHLEGIQKACVVGGGLGCAIAYPQAKALRGAGCHITLIGGFRDSGHIILEDEMRAVSDNLIICTDDGSNGRKALVTDELKHLLESGETFGAVIAAGPLAMMKYVCYATKPYEIKTYVSMSPLMVDGTGMCGCCRVTVDGQVKFACVDGPDFDGHSVDFDEAARRGGMYREQEAAACHACRLEGGDADA